MQKFCLIINLFLFWLEKNKGDPRMALKRKEEGLNKYVI